MSLLGRLGPSAPVEAVAPDGRIWVVSHRVALRPESLRPWPRMDFSEPGIRMILIGALWLVEAIVVVGVIFYIAPYLIAGLGILIGFLAVFGQRRVHATTAGPPPESRTSFVRGVGRSRSEQRRTALAISRGER